MIILKDMEQMSPEWFQHRCGTPSASGFDNILTPTGKPSTQAKKYMYQLAGERILGKKEETYQNATMQRGIDLEPEARGFFELVENVKVEQVGLCYPDEAKKYCMSPDGLMQDKKEGWECKCPLLHTHVEYLLKDKLPTKYIVQVQGSMMISGYKSWWFQSYYPGMPSLIIKVERDEEYIKKLWSALFHFCNDLDELEKEIRVKL